MAWYSKTVLITPVKDGKLVSQQTLLIQTPWYKPILELIGTIIKNTLALVGFINLIWWLFA